jgi:uncharacterized cysteine cluster protein YcgN (CxxCxxCC family)
MALLTERQVRRAAQSRVQKSHTVTARVALLEAVQAAAEERSFDIFLSHSVRDAELVLGTVDILESLGYSVYVDWIVDTQLDRSKVTAKTANTLRMRMRQSQSLFYLTTANAVTSKWMPWECGYFDGLKEKVAIIPLVQEAGSDAYHGQEYLGLYPYCTYDKNEDGDDQIWIHRDVDHYLAYPLWVVPPNAKLQWMTP